MSLKALLVRVAVDHSFGKWNGPCNPKNREFVYVPIPQDRENKSGTEKFYKDLIAPALQKFSKNNSKTVSLPHNLVDKRMHLDPDFNHLTYGDTKRRGKPLLDLDKGDLIVFYSGLKSIHDDPFLVYALIGIIVVDHVLRISDITSQSYDCNAHTRYRQTTDSDIVVFGKPRVSGRFRKYIPIGEYRNRSYRVKKDTLNDWGDIGVKDGWIQRSANLPRFLNASQFKDWLDRKTPEIVSSNN